MITTTAEDATQLLRLRELAGIKEDCSAGSTGAGAIAVAPAAMGKIKKREPSIEESPSLEHPEIGRKSVIGDTKPNQASKRLSANNAKKGLPTPNRINNGFKK